MYSEKCVHVFVCVFERRHNEGGRKDHWCEMRQMSVSVSCVCVCALCVFILVCGCLSVWLLICMFCVLCV